MCARARDLNLQKHIHEGTYNRSRPPLIRIDTILVRHFEDDALSRRRRRRRFVIAEHNASAGASSEAPRRRGRAALATTKGCFKREMREQLAMCRLVAVRVTRFHPGLTRLAPRFIAHDRHFHPPPASLASAQQGQALTPAQQEQQRQAIALQQAQLLANLPAPHADVVTTSLLPKYEDYSASVAAAVSPAAACTQRAAASRESALHVPASRC